MEKTSKLEETQLVLMLMLALALVAHASWQYQSKRAQMPDGTGGVKLRQVNDELLLVEYQTVMKADSQSIAPHLSPFFFEPVPINRAGKSLLVTLPGIGPAMADRIIRYRDRHGPVTTIEQLKNIPGIGSKRASQLVNHISFE